MSVKTNAGFLDNVPIGCGMDWFTDTAPDNWMLCQGQAISRTTYAQLFAIIGTTYGIGDGITTFNLPDFRGRTGVGKSATGIFNNLGNEAGTETNTLTVEQLPSHSHTVNDPGHSHSYTFTSGSAVNNFDHFQNQAGLETLNYSSASTSNSLTRISINNTGGGQAVNNIQPSIVINKIIKVK